MSTTTENFLKAISMVKPIPIIEKVYRLYYKDNGEFFYSTKDIPGKFIEITPEELAVSDRNIYIKDGNIHKKQMISIGKLVPTSDPTGTDITLPNVNTVEWKIKTYD